MVYVKGIRSRERYVCRTTAIVHHVAITTHNRPMPYIVYVCNVVCNTPLLLTYMYIHYYTYSTCMHKNVNEQYTHLTHTHSSHTQIYTTFNHTHTHSLSQTFILYFTSPWRNNGIMPNKQHQQLLLQPPPRRHSCSDS